MDNVVISLLAPAAPHQRVDSWVEEHVNRLRAQWRASGVRLGRLTKATPGTGGDWLIEVNRQDHDLPLEKDIALAAILTDLAISGLRPQLFVISRDRRSPIPQHPLSRRRRSVCPVIPA